MPQTRREFLVSASTLAGVAALTADVAKIVAAAAAARSDAAPRPRRYVKSTCAQCVNFCGIEVKVEDGAIRTIYPDAARAPYYNVGICPKGVAGGLNTFNPYRLKKPLRRTNPRKGLDQDPGWVEISWEEAFETMAARMRAIRADDPRKLVWQHGHGKYLIGDNFPKAFAEAFGTPNVVHRTTSCEAARHVADELTWGYHGFLPDLEHCNLLLNFGGNYYEGEQFSRWLDHTAVAAQERGMKIVVIEPRQSHCAAKADEWIPIRPGTDAVLLLGMAKILIEDATLDTDFLCQYTNAPHLVGADGRLRRDADGLPLVWAADAGRAIAHVEGVRPALRGGTGTDGAPATTAFDLFARSLEGITPAYVEDVTGVPAGTVERLARELGREARVGATVRLDGKPHRHRPVALHTFRGLVAKQHGLQTWRAGLLVQMLLGSIDAVGGINLHNVYSHPEYFEPSKVEYPPNRIDLQRSVFFPHAHHNVAQQVARSIADPKRFGLEYRPEMQIFYATNRPFSTADARGQFEGLTSTFNVVIDIAMTELAAMADIVLPDLTYLESWHLSPTRYTVRTKHTAIRQPVANAYDIPYDAYSILWELAKRLGMRDEYVRRINKRWKLKRYPLETGRDYSARAFVEHAWKEKTGGKSFEHALEHGFQGQRLEESGVYLSGVAKHFAAPGGPKMHFYAEQLVGTLEKVREVKAKRGLDAIDLDAYRIALAPLPRREHAFPTPHREANELPLYLITYKRMYRNQSGCTALNPILNALGPDTDENFVLVNRATAIELGIGDGDEVVVETRVGKVWGKPLLTETIRPDTVAVSYHYGHVAPGLPAFAKKGIWINSVLESHPDPVSGMDSFNDTKCRVYRSDKAERNA